MKALFAPKALYSSNLILPLAVSDSPSRPWQSQSRWAAVDHEIAEKYWSDWYTRLMAHPMTLRLVPVE